MLGGTYVGFIDSDDYIATDYVEKLLSKAFHKQADMVKCGYYWETLNGNEKHKNLYQSLSAENGLKNQILGLNGFVWGAVIKNNLFNDFRFTEGFWYEDMITRVIIYRKCKRFEFLNEPLYHYIQHETNISKKVEKNSNEKCLDQYFLTLKLYDLSNKIGLENNENLYKILQNECGTMLWSRTRGLDEEIRKSVFLCACDFMNHFKEEHKVNLSKYETYFKIAFQNYNYILWKLVSKNVRLKIGQ